LYKNSQEQTTVWKKLLMVVMVIGLLPLSSVATAQDKRVVVWHALSPEDTDALVKAADVFSEQTGVPVEFRYVQPPLLYETVAANRSNGPDVIIADNSIMEPLLTSKRIAPVRNSEAFFLADLVMIRSGAVSGRVYPRFCRCPCRTKTWPRAPPTGYANRHPGCRSAGAVSWPGCR
jgi:ABC-type molybdate transport system substrate-binding protein